MTLDPERVETLLILSISMLFGLSLLMVGGLFIFKGWARLLARWRAHRARFFGEALREWRAGRRKAPAAALKPSLPGDIDVLEALLIKEASMMSGRSKREIVLLMEKIGLVERRLHELNRTTNADDAKMVIEHLGLLGSPLAIKDLSARLHHEDESLCFLAARSLSRIGGPKSLKPIVGLIRHKARLNPRRWVSLLGRFKSDVLPAMRGLLENEDPLLRWLAVSVLGQIQEVSVGRQIAGLLKSDPEGNIREAAARALGGLASAAFHDDLQLALKDSVEAVRVRAAQALGNLGDPHAVEALEGALDDDSWQVRLEAAKALLELGPPGILALKRGGGDATNPFNKAIRGLKLK